MAQIESADILGNFLRGRGAGQDERRQKTLADYAQPAIGGDQNALAQVYSVDPNAGIQIQGMQQRQAAGDRDQMVEDLQRAAKLYPSAPDVMKGQLYSKIIELTEGVGLAAPGSLPRQHDPNLDAGFNKFLAGIAGPAGGEQFTLSPGSARYGSDGSMIASQPFAPEKQDFTLSPDGTQWLPKPTSTQPPMGPAISGLSPEQDFAALGGEFGLKPTSIRRTPEHNRAVGGVPSSFHLSGQASDWVVPDAQKANFRARAEARGYKVIDEGDHMHIEPSGRNQVAPSTSGAIPIPGAKPRGKPSFTMVSPEEAAQYGLTPGTVAQRNDETGQVSVVSKPDARAGTGVMPLSAGEAAKVRRDFKETKDALSTFKAFDQALGDIPEGINLVVDGAAKGRLGTSYNNARAALRILYNTGVLQPGELPMLESALRDPTAFSAIMDPRTRPQIQSQLDELYRTVTRGIENQVASYPQIFNQQKFDDFRSQRELPQGAPAAGAVEAGYRFKGGDPANPSNWEKV